MLAPADFIGYRRCQSCSASFTRHHLCSLSAWFPRRRRVFRPNCSSLLLILSSSRLLVPDFPLLVPAPSLSSVPLHEMAFRFLSDRNPLWTPSNQTSRRFFFSATISLPCFPFRACLPSHQVSVGQTLQCKKKKKKKLQYYIKFFWLSSKLIA